jgi:hypothetical protein
MTSDWADRSGVGILPPDVRAVRMACQSWKEILTYYYGVSGVKVDSYQDDETYDIMIGFFYDDEFANRRQIKKFSNEVKNIQSDIPVTFQKNGGITGLTFHNAEDIVNFLGYFLAKKIHEIGQSLTGKGNVYYTYKSGQPLPDFAIRHLNFAIYAGGTKSLETELTAAYAQSAHGHPMFHLTFHPWEIARIYNASKRSEIKHYMGHISPTAVGWYN